MGDREMRRRSLKSWVRRFGVRLTLFHLENIGKRDNTCRDIKV